MSWYITPDQYAEAERNGISYKLLTERVRVLGWNIKRAMTEPRQRQRIHGSLVKWVKIAKANGIGRNEFYSRINKLGWPLEKAATTPIMTRSEAGKRGGRALAEKNPRTHHGAAEQD